MDEYEFYNFVELYCDFKIKYGIVADYFIRRDGSKCVIYPVFKKNNTSIIRNCVVFFKFIKLNPTSGVKLTGDQMCEFELAIKEANKNGYEKMKSNIILKKCR